MHLEEARKNRVTTRNVRLAAIHAFFRYVGTYHPERLLLNNMAALLIMDEVRLKRASIANLGEAKLLLEEAVARVREMQSDFHWPEESLSLCLDLIQDSPV